MFVERMNEQSVQTFHSELFIEHLLCAESCSRCLRQVPGPGGAYLQQSSTNFCDFFFFSSPKSQGRFVPLIVSDIPDIIQHSG